MTTTGRLKRWVDQYLPNCKIYPSYKIGSPITDSNLTFLIFQIPLRGTPHQVTYYPEKNLYPLIVSVPVSYFFYLIINLTDMWSSVV